MDRRDFFSSTFQTFLGAMVLSSCRSHVPYQTNSGKGQLLVGLNTKSSGSILRILNLDDYSSKDYQLPIKEPHSVNRSQWNPNQLFIFGTGSGALILDLTDGSLIPVENSEGMSFNGHGAQVLSEKIMWCSENDKTGRIFIRARNASDLSLINGEEYTFEGGHHVTKIPDSSFLVSGGVTSKGKVVRVFDHTKRSIAHEYNVDFIPVHFLQLSSTELIAVTASNKNATMGNFERANFPVYGDLAAPAPLIYFTTGGEFKYVWGEEQNDLLRLGFSASKLSSDSFLTGHLKSGKVILWKNFKMVKSIDVGLPISIVLSKDGTQFVVQSGNQIKIFALDSMELLKTIKYEESVISMSAYR